MGWAVWRRVLLYPLNFLISYTVLLLVLVFPDSLSSRETLYMVATCLEVLNGFINVCTFALQSRVARRILYHKGFALGISCWDSTFEASDEGRSGPEDPIETDRAHADSVPSANN
jgi:hypothetical protein